MKELGKMIFDMEKDSNVMRMVTHILATLELVKLMEKEFIHGKMEKFLMDNGIKDLSTATVFGKGYMEILLLENG